MIPQTCGQCSEPCDQYTTYIGLQRGSFKATYQLGICWNCFEIFREMAHSTAYSWRRLQPERQGTLPFKLLE
jgi:hypothetical protein